MRHRTCSPKLAKSALSTGHCHELGCSLHHQNEGQVVTWSEGQVIFHVIKAAWRGFIGLLRAFFGLDSLPLR